MAQVEGGGRADHEEDHRLEERREHREALLGQRPRVLGHVRVGVALGDDAAREGRHDAGEVQRLRELVGDVLQ